MIATIIAIGGAIWRRRVALPIWGCAINSSSASHFPRKIVMDNANNIEAAVLAAIAFFEKMYADENLRDVLLEEVKERDDEHWDVTIGYSQLEQEQPAMTALTQGAKYKRVYKVLTVEKSTAAIKSMTLRNI